MSSNRRRFAGVTLFSFFSRPHGAAAYPHQPKEGSMPATIIDRRQNPGGKSMGNRQRFSDRARRLLQKHVHEADLKGRIADIGTDERIRIKKADDSLREPVFRPDLKTGTQQHVLPGNKEYRKGDRIKVPDGSSGNGGGTGGDGEDSFVFALSREEFFDLFLDDLALPDLEKTQLMRTMQTTLRRAGYTTVGSPSRMSIPRTMRHGLARRIAMRGAIRKRIESLEKAIRELEARDPKSDALMRELADLRAQLDAAKRRLGNVPFIDPVDLRYRRFERQELPATQAVMFCLMDVSGSMGEHEKDLAKRFYVLLYLFLTRTYRHVDIVFIRHTHVAAEVDEQTFFYGTESGGTIVSTAFREMLRIVADRYDPADWNIYAAQASDGDNSTGDNPTVAMLMSAHILPLVQYFAYIEVDQKAETGSDRSALWQTYRLFAESHREFAMRHVSDRTEIYPVFRSLFERKQNGAHRYEAA